MTLATLSTNVPWMCINCVSAVSLCCFFCPPPSTNTCRFYTLTCEISSGSLLPLAASATPLEGLYKTSLAPMETAITAFLCRYIADQKKKQLCSFVARKDASFETAADPQRHADYFCAKSFARFRPNKTSRWDPDLHSGTLNSPRRSTSVQGGSTLSGRIQNKEHFYLETKRSRQFVLLLMVRVPRRKGTQMG